MLPSSGWLPPPCSLLVKKCAKAPPPNSRGEKKAAVQLGIVVPTLSSLLCKLLVLDVCRVGCRRKGYAMDDCMQYLTHVYDVMYVCAVQTQFG